MVLGGCVFNIFESKKIRGTVLADTFEVGDYWGGSDYNTRGAVLGVSCRVASQYFTQISDKKLCEMMMLLDDDRKIGNK